MAGTYQDLINYIYNDRGNYTNDTDWYNAWDAYFKSPDGMAKNSVYSQYASKWDDVASAVRTKMNNYDSGVLDANYNDMYTSANKTLTDAGTSAATGLTNNTNDAFKTAYDLAVEGKANAEAQAAYSAEMQAKIAAQDAAFNKAYAAYSALGDANQSKYSGEQDKAKAALADKTSAYDSWAKTYTDNAGKIADTYNTKADALQRGEIPTAFTDNEKKILQTTADEGMASLLKKYANSGVINSSVSRAGINDLGYGITKTMNESYKDTIDKLMGYATKQAETDNTLRNDDYTIGNNSYKQGFDNLKQSSDLNTTTATSYADLLKNQYNMLSDANKASQDAIANQYNVGQKAYDFTGANINDRTSSAANAYAAQATGLKDLYSQQSTNAYAPLKLTSTTQGYQNDQINNAIKNFTDLYSGIYGTYNTDTSYASDMSQSPSTVVTQNQKDNTLSSLIGAAGSYLGSAKCFVAGTMIDVADGEMPIEQVKAGQQVDTINGYRTVEKTIIGTSPTVRIVTDMGEVKTTPTEHFITQRGSVPVFALKFTDTLICKGGFAHIQSMQKGEDEMVYEIVAPYFFANGFVIDGFDPEVK